MPQAVYHYFHHILYLETFWDVRRSLLIASFGEFFFNFLEFELKAALAPAAPKVLSVGFRCWELKATI